MNESGKAGILKSDEATGLLNLKKEDSSNLGRK